MKKDQIRRVATCALFIALSYVGFQFLRIDIPVGTERTAIHLGNVFVVIGALLEGFWGGMSGALGLTLADLTSGYTTSAPKTFILKLVMGLIATLVARLVRKKYSDNKKKGELLCAVISSIAALGVNVFLDPIFGYFYKSYILGVPQELSAALSKIGSITTLVNAVASALIVIFLWPLLRNALEKAHLLSNSSKG